MKYCSQRKSKKKSRKYERKKDISTKHVFKSKLTGSRFSKSKTSTHRKRSELPLYSRKVPKKSSLKKRPSAGLKVVWSPKVKHIERTPKKSHNKNSRRHNPQPTNIYIKFKGQKTIKISGILHAQYKNKTQLIPIVVFKLHDNQNNITIHITINLSQQSVLNIKYINEEHNTTQLLKQMKNGNQPIRLLFKFGDIIWIHGKTEIYRKCNTKGFNVRWLQQLYDSQYSDEHS